MSPFLLAPMQADASTTPGVSLHNGFIVAVVAMDCSQWWPVVQMATEATFQGVRLAQCQAGPVPACSTANKHVPRTLPGPWIVRAFFSPLYLCSCGSSLLECLLFSLVSVSLQGPPPLGSHPRYHLFSKTPSPGLFLLIDHPARGY